MSKREAEKWTPQLASSQLELLQALLRATPDAVYTKDLEGRYLSINAAGAQFLGKPAEEILGRTDLELMPSAEDARMTAERDRSVLLGGETITYEVEDGQPGEGRVWLSTKGCLRDPGGRVFGLYGISRDITERKRMEQRLKMDEERLRLCIEAARLASWDWDLRTGRVAWSGNSERVLGIPLAELNRDSDAFLAKVHPEDRERVVRVISAALRKPGDEVIEFRLAEPRHPPRWLRGQGRALWKEGQPVRALGVVMDVSAQKQAEEELRRNAVFQNQLIGIVSHDIRSPVSAIVGWASMLYGAPDGETVSESADRIITSAERIERLTKRLLDLTEARLGRGIPVSVERVSIHEVAERIVDEARAVHPDRVVLLDAGGDGNGVWDPDRLGQVISNLLENALKYSPPQSPVHLSLQGDGRWVELKVHNAGEPIGPELLPVVFEPFLRGGHDARGRRSLGLGLYIVRELVESHGGVIEVSSTVAEGTTFTVRLPQLHPGQAPEPR